MEVRYYVSDAGRCPFDEFLRATAMPFRGQILADLALLGREGDKAPISKKPIKGNKPMWELRIGGYRVFFVRIASVFWILGACKKQDQKREIAASSKRMRSIGGRP